MENPAEVDVRCSVTVFRKNRILLVHRTRDGADDWVLPGGTPHPGESMAACAERETLKETGLRVVPGGLAFVLEALGPYDTRRIVDLVFLAAVTGQHEPQAREGGLEAVFVPLGDLPAPNLRPPVAEHLRGLHSRGPARTAAYLGNLWWPDRREPANRAEPEAAGENRVASPWLDLSDL